MRNVLIFVFICFSAALCQGWLQQTPSGEPAVQQAPFDSSQIIADRITKSKIPVIVDFWAPWCRPCRMLAPTMEELEKKYEGKLLFVKVNIDADRALAAYFKIVSIPAVFFIVDKTVKDFVPGLQDRSVYESSIQKILAASGQGVSSSGADASRNSSNGSSEASKSR
jgi:thioredoxin 1